MSLTELLIPTRVLANAPASSGKGALEVLSQLLGKNQDGVEQPDIMRALVARERLGSTIIGNGIAAPHGRIDGIDAAVGALIRLSDPIVYGYEDDALVDILLAVLVPTRCTDKDTILMSNVAARLRNPAVAECMRKAKTSNALHQCFQTDVAQAQE